MNEFMCPTDAWDCPYCGRDGRCRMIEDGDNPIWECDDAGWMYDPEEDADIIAEVQRLADNYKKLNRR